MLRRPGGADGGRLRRAPRIRLTGEWMYVFKPAVADTVVYLKLVVRTACVVVSFHEDEGEADEEP